MEPIIPNTNINDLDDKAEFTSANLQTVENWEE